MNRDELIKKTFCREAVRTATLIDDKFPTYAHLLGGRAKEFSESEKAGVLYRACKNRNIICDIENDVEKLSGPQFEQIRKSDLIVLDYHLRTGDDASDALQFLSHLAESKHFNLVVLYTRETNLARVWLRVASTLKQGLRHAKEILADNGELLDLWEKLKEGGQLPPVSEQVLAAYVVGGTKNVPRESDTELRKELDTLSVPKPHQTRLLEVLFEGELLRSFSDSKFSLRGPPRKLAGRSKEGVPPWLHCGTIFVAMMSKRPDAGPCDGDDPEGIFNCIENALTDWSPNVIQILISEIQNTLEQKALAYDHVALDEPEVQAGWLYHLAKESSHASDQPANVSLALTEFYSRIFDTVRRNFELKSDLPTIGAALLESLAKEHNIGAKSDKEIAEIAATFIHPTAKLQPNNILHALNQYLSSEAFRLTHITTGTIFASPEDNWWVCVSPACDMVPRQPWDLGSWYRELHPLRPMTALRLEKVTVAAALKDAEQGRYIFVTAGGERLAFRACEGTTGQPRTELFLLADEGRVFQKERLSFTAERVIWVAETKSASLNKSLFFPVLQLREAYGARLLQQTGNHTSRIGVDFVRFAAG